MTGNNAVIRTVVFAMLLTFVSAERANAFGLTVDQMYRNVMDSEREGLVPSSEKPVLAFKKADSKPEAIWREKKAFFEKRSQRKTDFQQAGDWKEIVSAVKKGNVTPFDLAEIHRLSEHEDAEAIELLAWMYATGTGLKRDLQKSYTYYLQAAHMGVASAYDNVRTVYRAMTPAQRASLPSF